MRSVADSAPDHNPPRSPTEPDPTFALTCAIGGTLRECLGARLGVTELDAAAEAVTARLLRGAGRSLVDYNAGKAELRYVGTLIAAARNFTCDLSEIHHLENALEMASDQLDAARVALWGPELGS